MKKYICFLMMMLFVQTAWCQIGKITPDEYENRKALAIGFTYQNLSLRGLNNILEQNGYGSVTEGTSCISVTHSVHYNDGLGFFYGADFGLDNESKKTGKYKKSQYYRAEAGIEYRALQLQHLACFAHLGLGYSSYTLRLYDHAPDSSLDNYAKESPDAKRLQTGLFGMNVGFQSRIYLGQAPYLGFGAGCIIPFGNSTWHHDGGDFKDAPSVLLGTWYAQVKVGLEFHRKITHIANDILPVANEKKVSEAIQKDAIRL